MALSGSLGGVAEDEAGSRGFDTCGLSDGVEARRLCLVEGAGEGRGTCFSAAWLLRVHFN